MAKKKSVLTDEVSALLHQLLDALPEETASPKPVPASTGKTSRSSSKKAKSDATAPGQTWPRDKANIRRVRAALRRSLGKKGDLGRLVEGDQVGRLGRPLQFTRPNPIDLSSGERFIYPSLDELTDYYKKRYPKQVEAHYVGRRALFSLLNVEGVTAVKIKYGLLPDYESALTSLPQRLIIRAIYRLQQLLTEEEPRQLVFVGVNAAGDEIRRVSSNTEGANLSGSLGGIHDTGHALRPSSTQSFPHAVPPITMNGREPGEGIDMVPNSPPNP